MRRKQRYIYVVITSMLAFMFFSYQAQAAGNDVVPDGCVNILDYEAQQQNFHNSGNGDVDGNGRVDAKDLSYVMHDWKGGCVDNAQFITQTTPPSSIAKTGHQTMSFTIKNTGNSVWTQSENYSIIQVRSQADPNAPYDPTTWGPSSITIGQPRVLPNQTTSFSINITAPTTPGAYPMIWRMANVSAPQRFGDYSTEKKVSVYDPQAPNIVFILTDDLNFATWNGISNDFAPYLQNKGLTFTNFLIPNSLCCPSRATILRGQYSHNTKIVDNQDTTDGGSLIREGGWEQVHRLEIEDSTVGTWLHDRGYYTLLSGKYFNNYENYTEGRTGMYVPPGWDFWHGANVDNEDVSSGFVNSEGNEDTYTKDPNTGDGYLTTVIKDDALRAINNAGNQPFFMYLAPHAPHGPAESPNYYDNDFSNITMPEASLPSFNESGVAAQDKPYWIQQLPAVPNDPSWEKKRLRSMELIRDMTISVVNELQAKGKLDNTYIIFTSDNGLHNGQHSLQRGKGTAYEEDIRVPFIIRGPGVPQGQSINHLVANQDLAPTFADLADVTPPSFIDGKSFVPLLSPTRPQPSAWRNQVLLRFMGDVTGSIVGYPGAQHHYPDPTVYAIRTQNYTYVDYPPAANHICNFGTGAPCGEEEELYDLVNDPLEINSQHANPAYATIKQQLKTKMQALENCAGDSCRAAELTP